MWSYAASCFPCFPCLPIFSEQKGARLALRLHRLASPPPPGPTTDCGVLHVHMCLMHVHRRDQRVDPGEGGFAGHGMQVISFQSLAGESFKLFSRRTRRRRRRRGRRRRRSSLLLSGSNGEGQGRGSQAESAGKDQRGGPAGVPPGPCDSVPRQARTRLHSRCWPAGPRTPFFLPPLQASRPLLCLPPPGLLPVTWQALPAALFPVTWLALPSAAFRVTSLGLRPGPFPQM